MRGQCMEPKILVLDMKENGGISGLYSVTCSGFLGLYLYIFLEV
jgi:hypothetical protein